MNRSVQCERVATAAMPEKTSYMRMYVTRAATGKVEVYYSYDRVPFWDFFRWLRQRAHLAFMRAEDRALGYGKGSVI